MAVSRRGILKGFTAIAGISPILRSSAFAASAGTPRFIDVAGVRTRYFEAGQGEALVLIHGGRFGSVSYSAGSWNLNFEELARHFRVYAFDKLGMGYTDNPRSDADYTKRAVIRHAFDFMTAAGIDRAHLVGHSMGALVAARLAIEYPDRVRSLVVLDSKALAPDDPAAPEDFYLKLEEDLPDVPTREYVRREPEANSYSKNHVTEAFVDDLMKIAELPKMAEMKRKAKLTRLSFLAEVRELKNKTMDQIRAGGLKAPTLIVWGFNDASAPLVLGQHLMNVVFPAVLRSEFHVFNQAGHYAFREHAERLNRLIVDFISSA